jgi:hypothetical protein
MIFHGYITSYDMWRIFLRGIVIEGQDLSAMHPACCFENIVAILNPPNGCNGIGGANLQPRYDPFMRDSQADGEGWIKHFDRLMDLSRLCAFQRLIKDWIG